MAVSADTGILIVASIYINMKKNKMIIILVVAVVVFVFVVIAITPSTTSMGSSGDCTVAQTDWINSKIIRDDWSQAQGEDVQGCKVPGNLQGRIVSSCDVAKTDWINSKMIENDWSQAQGEAAQKCKVPDNLQARIT